MKIILTTHMENVKKKELNCKTGFTLYGSTATSYKVKPDTVLNQLNTLKFE